MIYNSFYLVGRSYFPIWLSLMLFSLTTSIVIFLSYGLIYMLFLSSLSLVYNIIFWVMMTSYESMCGMHMSKFLDAIKFSFMLFVFSEVMFFFSVFWAFFDSALNPSVELGNSWSPSGLNPINPMGIPLFNTIVLLSSGATMTWSHNCLIEKSDLMTGMYFTCLLAFMFEYAQYIEFCESTFSMSDGIFGSVFFFGTGFHGMHVMFGHIFMIFSMYRMYFNHYTPSSHCGFELGAIYWHLVDVVWLFLYCFFYLFTFGL